jgi:hypothetical protein
MKTCEAASGCASSHQAHVGIIHRVTIDDTMTPYSTSKNDAPQEQAPQCSIELNLGVIQTKN